MKTRLFTPGPTPVPGNNRDAWLGQETGRSNHELSGKGLTVGQRDPPQLGMPVLPDAFDGGVEHVGGHDVDDVVVAVDCIPARATQ